MNVIFPKKSGVEHKRNGFNSLPILFLVLFLNFFTHAQSAQARSTFDRSISRLGAQLMEHYQTVGTAFWQAEDLRDAQTITPAQRKVLLALPIFESHPAHPKYFQAAVAADSFLKLADENKMHNWMCDPVLYFGGLSGKSTFVNFIVQLINWIKLGRMQEPKDCKRVEHNNSLKY